MNLMPLTIAKEAAGESRAEAPELARWRPSRALPVSRRRRAAALALALLVEGLLVLVLLLVGAGGGSRPGSKEQALSTFEVAPPIQAPEPRSEPEQATREVQVKAEQASSAEVRLPQPSRPAPRAEVPEPAVRLPSLVELPAEVMAVSDLRTLPPLSPSKTRGPSGPPAPRGAEADTPLVDGSGPNGERLYAASWYREPYDSELRGYLSTAQPGWALIACRTVEDFRVEDCVAVDEWPSGSKLARAVLAAAWQFKVRPPRIGGKVQVGEWVRIRIDYGIKRERSWR